MLDSVSSIICIQSEDYKSQSDGTICSMSNSGSELEGGSSDDENITGSEYNDATGTVTAPINKIEKLSKNSSLSNIILSDCESE